MRLSYLWITILAASTPLVFSEVAQGQTLEPVSDSAPQPAPSVSGASSLQNAIVPALRVPDSSEISVSQNIVVPTEPVSPPGEVGQTPSTPSPGPLSPSPAPPEIPPAGTESTPQQETPNQIEFNITPPAPSPTPAIPPQPTPTVPPTPAPTPTPTPSESEARVLVAEVQVRGVEGELQDRAFQALSTRPGRATTRSQLQQDVNAIFATGFFSRVEFVPEDTPLGVRVTFVVEPNPVLRNVNVTTVPETTQQRVLPPQVVDEIFRPQYGRILNFKELQEGIKRLNQWYTDNGYQLAQVIDAPQVSADGTVNLVVAEGVVEDIQVLFLNKDGEATNDEGQPVGGRTRPFIITREVQLKPGDVFNRRIAEQDLRRVFGLGVFEDVRLSFSPGQDPRRVVVVVNVIERNTGSIAAGLGISSASGLFGTVSYQEQNLGGNNQRLGAELQVGQRELLFDVSFTDPWIAGDPFRTSYTANLFRRRSISLIFDGGPNDVTLPDGSRPRIVRLGGGVTFSRPLTSDLFADPEWRASLGLQYQQIAVRDASGNLAPRDELGNPVSFSDTGRDDLLTLQFGAVRDRRNNPLSPTQGSLLRFNVDQSIPIGQGNILLNRLRGSYSQYIPVSFTNFAQGPQALAFNVQGGTILGDLPPYEAFALGGSFSVRGYDEGYLGSGRSFVQATAEYRFPILSILGGALFVDAASDLGTGNTVPGDPAGVRGKPGSGFGYGAGVRIQSPLGPIRIDYGFNNQGESRIHFGIGERF